MLERGLFVEIKVLHRHTVKVKVSERSAVYWAANQADKILVAPVGSDDSTSVAGTNVSAGRTSAWITMPAIAGEYEIRYILFADKSVISRVPVTVEEN